jgi:hypothetical protein
VPKLGTAGAELALSSDLKGVIMIKTMKVDLDAYRLVEDLAKAQGISLQQAASDVIRRAFEKQADQDSNVDNSSTATDRLKDYEAALQRHFDSIFGEGAWQGWESLSTLLEREAKGIEDLIQSSNEQQARLQELQNENTNLQQQISESQSRIRALEEALRGERSRHESELASLRADYEREIAQREREINDLKAKATTQVAVPAPAAANAPKPAIIEKKFDPTGPLILIGAAAIAFFIIRSLWQGFAINRSESVGPTADEEEKEVQSAAPVQANPPTDPSYLMLKSLGAIS